MIFNGCRYTYTSIFGVEIMVAATFTEYWHWKQSYRVLFIYVLAALTMLGINLSGVFVFHPCPDASAKSLQRTVLWCRRNYWRVFENFYGTRLRNIHVRYKWSR